MSGHSKQYQHDQAEQRALMDAIHVAAMARVVDFHPDAMTVDVQPISQRLEGGEYAAPSLVPQVPIAGTRGGGFLYRPWFQSGDVGLLVYLDHDSDNALEQGADCQPNTERSHSDSDPIFLGGLVVGGWTSSGLPEGLVLAEESGSVYLAITKDGIQIKGNVQVDGDVVAGGISLNSHTHSGVESGAGSSGGPQ